MECFLLNGLLKVFLFLKVCDSGQVKLEAMVLDYPKLYNYEYCSDFSLQPYVMKIEVSSVLYSLLCLCVISELVVSEFQNIF